MAREDNKFTKMAARAAKQLLRKEIKQAIKTLSEAEKERQSQIVISKLIQTDVYQKSKRVCIFLSMPDEVKTASLLEHIFNTGKQCFIPRYDEKSTQMDMLKINTLSEYESWPETKWKIKQPDLSDNSHENCLDTGGVDLIVMPGLAFTPAGDRLGRGKGYYDTYLAKYQSAVGQRPPLVALAYNQQVVQHVPTHEHDVPVDMVLWEKGAL